MSIRDHAASTTRPGSRRSAHQPHIDAAGFGAWHWSTASGEVVFSPCAAAIHGIDPDDFAGTLDAFGKLIHPEDRDRAIAALFSAFAAGADRFVEYRTSAPEGASPWVFNWVGSVSGDHQTAAGLTAVCLGSDISHHPDQALERARSQFGLILDGVTDGITVQAPAGDHVYANAAAHHIFGIHSVADLRALSARERRERFASTDEAGNLIPGHQFPTTRALRGEAPEEMLLQLQPLDGGDRRWVTLTSTPITDAQGSVRFVVNRLRDMTEERRRQEEMSESETRYRQLFEGNPVPMWVFDTHTLRFLAVNDAAVHEYGWSRPEFLSLTLLDIRPPEDRPAILDKLAYITATPDGLDVAGVWRHRRRDGTLLDAEVTTHAITFDGRDARVSLAINVTERTRHERRLERLSALTAALSAALGPREVAKVVGRYATSAGADVAAVATFSPTDQTITVLHRTGYPAHIREQSEPFPVTDPTLLGLVIRTGQPIIAPAWDEFDRQHPELADSREFAGENGAGAGLILPLADGRPIGALKMGFRHPRAFSPTLLDELRTIANLCAQALERAQLYHEAQEAVRARDEFLSAAAHELRTPVTTVKGYAQMLLRAQARDELASDRVTRFLQAIDESTDRLRVLTDDLLDVSRLRLGQMPLYPRSVDLVALIGRLVERYEPQFDPRHTLTLTSDTPAAVVSVDLDRIEQVLANLIENAAKYSPDGGPITITIAGVDHGIRISVTDSGIGLPAESLETIFEPFSRAENAIRDNVPGLGLGLYICASIVRRHGGRIEAESAGEGHGTTFHLWLPIDGPAPGSAP